MRIRGQLTYSNAMSTVAVFLALAGGSYAIASVGKNDVGSSEVKNESLKSKDLKDEKAVESSDVVDESLTGADIDLSTLPADPAAYAVVVGSTTNVSAGTGQNITSEDVVKRDFGGELDGQYCVSTSASGIKNAIVSDSSTVSTTETDRIATVTVSLGALAGCPAGTAAFVRIWDVSDDDFVDSNFTIWMTD